MKYDSGTVTTSTGRPAFVKPSFWVVRSDQRGGATETRRPMTRARTGTQVQPPTDVVNHASPARTDGEDRTPCTKCRVAFSEHEGTFGIECERCMQWWYGKCTGLNAKQRRSYAGKKNWTCPVCPEAAPQEQQQEQQQQQAPGQPTVEEQAKARLSTGEAQAVFGLSHGRPPTVTELKGGFVHLLSLHGDQTQAWLTQEGKVKEVRKRHANRLKKLQEGMTEALAQLPLAEALVRIHQDEMAARSWSWATLHRELANTAGAFTSLPIYSNAPWSITLSQAAAWKEAMAAAEKRRNEAEGRALPAASVDDVRQAMGADPAARAVLLLQWLTAGRRGCVLKLQRRDVQLEEDGGLRVQFRRGKGVRFRGPYTVPTKCPAEWLPLLRQYLETKRPTDALFPFSGPNAVLADAVRRALQRVNPFLGSRELRRGSLQTMALAGTPPDQLMTFSGHTSQRTLLRYLDWGRLAKWREAAAHAAADQLAGQPSA
jgi:integrase